MDTTHCRACDLDDYVTEIYDQTETQTEDVVLLRQLLSGREPLRILEPFCGSGRILIPLAEDGHTLVGLDKSKAMLASAARKIRDLAQPVRERITLVHSDVTTDRWPGGFDVVVLGGNCFYELATAAEQEGCVRSARSALRPGGYLYLDNDHMEGDLDPEWSEPGINENVFPTGTCADGTRIQGTWETIWFDAQERLWRARRTIEVTTPDGVSRKRDWVQQKHPPSTGEMRQWLETHGFDVLELWGDRSRSEYTDRSGRAVFRARLGD